jgi:hypothetical protein
MNDVQLNILIRSKMLQFLLRMVRQEESFTPNDFQIPFKYTILKVYGNSEGSQHPENVNTKINIYALTCI